MKTIVRVQRSDIAHRMMLCMLHIECAIKPARTVAMHALPKRQRSMPHFRAKTIIQSLTEGCPSLVINQQAQTHTISLQVKT